MPERWRSPAWLHRAVRSRPWRPTPARARPRSTCGRAPTRSGGDVPRAVLRPRLRLRGHPALAPPARAPHVRRRGRNRLPAPGRVVGVDLHDLDDELVRPRVGRGARGAGRGDAREPADGDRDPGRVRRPRGAVRGVLRRAPGDPQRLHRRRDGQGAADARRVRADPRLERHGRRGLDHGRDRARRLAGADLDRRARPRLRSAVRRLLDAAPRADVDDRPGDRGRALRRALPAVHHHRARRVDRRDRRDRLEPRPRARQRRRADRRLPRLGGALVALLRRGRRPLARAPPHVRATPRASAATPTPTSTSRSWPGSSRPRSATRS